jgi:hypothetical protein
VQLHAESCGVAAVAAAFWLPMIVAEGLPLVCQQVALPVHKEA